jgi:hypothetical protein
MTAADARPAPTLTPSASAGGEADPGTLAVANAALRGGFVLLPRAVLHAPELSRDAKLLYAVLLSYAWQGGSCFPGYQRLQADLGCGVNQITKYLRELEGAGLVTRRRRGLGKTTVYTLHDVPPPPRAEPDRPAQSSATPAPPLIHQIGESRVTNSVKAVSPVRRHEQDSGEQDPGGHHPPPLAPAAPASQEVTGAVDDALFELLIAQGVTRRIAHELVATYPAEAIREQLACQAYRPKAKSPAGALVRAIRDAWPPPPAWLEAREHAAAVARQAEDEARRREEEEARRRAWAAKPPEERIAGRLQFWLLGQRRKGHEPSETEIATRRAELLAELGAPPPAAPAVVPGPAAAPPAWLRPGPPGGLG